MLLFLINEFRVINLHCALTELIAVSCDNIMISLYEDMVNAHFFDPVFDFRNIDYIT